MSGEEGYPAVKYLCEEGLDDLSREEAVAILAKFEHEIGALVGDIGLPGYGHVCKAVRETRRDLNRSKIGVEDVDTNLREHVDENDPSLLLLRKISEDSTLNAIASEFHDISENANSFREFATGLHHAEQKIKMFIRRLGESTDEEWSPNQIEFDPQTGSVVPPAGMEEDSIPDYLSAVRGLSKYTPFVEEPIFDRLDKKWSVKIFVNEAPESLEWEEKESEFESFELPDLSSDEE